MADDKKELLAEIHEKCLNFLASASLPVPDSIHREALTGALEDIRDMTKNDYDDIVGGQ